jgi:prevent-host-death family protein
VQTAIAPLPKLSNRLGAIVYHQIRSEFSALPMIKLENIHPLTDFKRNAKAFVERIKATQSPIVLTVNGKAEVVLQDAAAFQAMLERLQQVEAELRDLKHQTLKQDLALGIQQLQTGESSDYDDDSLARLQETIRSRGRKRLEQSNSQ